MAHYEIAQVTDPGLLRRGNEDASLVLQWCSTGEDGASLLLAAVADGMGGHSAGEVASSTVIRALGASVTGAVAESPPSGEYGLERVLGEAVSACGQQLEAASAGSLDMGTTLVAALCAGRRLVVANLGDSRAYLIGNTIRQITADHSLVAELVNRGEITRAQARSHPARHRIYRALSPGSPVEPDFFSLELSPGELLLLCTDGLTDVVEDSEIRSALTTAPSLRSGCQGLVALAKERGGPDNITLVAVMAK